MNNKTYSLFSLALSSLKAGDFNNAETSCRKALRLEPDNAKVLALLGLTLFQKGEMDEGIRCMRASLKVEPMQPDVWNNLGHALHLRGEQEKALVSIDNALIYAPHYVSALYNRGNVLHQLGRYKEAVDSFAKAISISPYYVDAYINMGDSLKELKEYEKSLECNDKAISLAPDRLEVRINRGLILMALNRHKEALDSFSQIVRLAPDFAEAYMYRGEAWQNLNCQHEALENFNRAIEINPNVADAYAKRGLALMQFGLMKEAKDSLEQALRIDPNHIASYYHLSALGKYSEKTIGFDGLKELYDRRASLPRTDQITVCFSMGKALEDIGKYDEAFHAYAEGNRLEYLQHPYDDAGADELLDWVISTFSRELFENYSKIEDAESVEDEKVPIFILGMPRSGSTLVEQVLASHPAVFGAGELNVIDEIIQEIKCIPHDGSDWRISLSYFRQMGQKYLEQVWRLKPNAIYITDKMPGNYRYLGLIHLMLPNAKIIHTVREPMDTCFSCYSLHFADGHYYSFDLQALGRYYRRYEKYMQHWHNVLPKGRILNIRYEDNVENPEKEARRMLEYLGLPWNDACLKHHENKRRIQTASVTQVRKPIYSTSVQRWRRFEKHLGALIEIVSDAV